jgi:glycosyltransferase involved in cell wall biosynthesis
MELRVLGRGRQMLVWENTSFARAADEDVAFHPSFSIPLVRRGRTVVTIHDLVTELHPELFSRQQSFYNRLYRWSARHATLVITDSTASRDDMVRAWGVPESRIRVVYLAPDDIFGPRPGDPAVADAHRRFVGDESPFFLFVGKMSGRRNVPVLLEAFADFKRRSGARQGHRLVLIGADIHGLDVAGRARALGLGDSLVHHDYVSDDDLPLLYNAAQAYVTPSVYETTSLPALEAQVSRTPVITINTVGMREVTGGAALLIPRLDVREMAIAMERLASDVDTRTRLAEEGARSVARFTWERSAAATLDVLEEAARVPQPARANRPVPAE